MSDLRRCTHCGRTGTLTSLSAGNTCEQQDDCERARQEAIDAAAAVARGVGRRKGSQPALVVLDELADGTPT